MVWDGIWVRTAGFYTIVSFWLEICSNPTKIAFLEPPRGKLYWKLRPSAYGECQSGPSDWNPVRLVCASRWECSEVWSFDPHQEQSEPVAPMLLLSCLTIATLQELTSNALVNCCSSCVLYSSCLYSSYFDISYFLLELRRLEAILFVLLSVYLFLLLCFRRTLFVCCFYSD